VFLCLRLLNHRNAQKRKPDRKRTYAFASAAVYAIYMMPRGISTANATASIANIVMMKRFWVFGFLS